MKNIVFGLICCVSLGCSNSYSEKLSSEISALYSSYSSGQDKYGVLDDATAKTLTKDIKQIFETHGIVGLDNANDEDYYRFWEVTQRFLTTIELQKSQIERIRTKVDAGNFNASIYASVVDRYYLDQNQPQVYGTQFDINQSLKKLTPKPIQEPDQVDTLRENIGLKPLNDYLTEQEKYIFGDE